MGKSQENTMARHGIFSGRSCCQTFLSRLRSLVNKMAIELFRKI